MTDCVYTCMHACMHECISVCIFASIYPSAGGGVMRCINLDVPPFIVIVETSFSILLGTLKLVSKSQGGGGV